MNFPKIVFLMVTVALLAVVLAAQNGPPAGVPRVIDDNDVVPLRGNVPPFVQAQNDRGPTNVALPYRRMIMVLAPRVGTEADLARLIDSLHDPRSPQYHQWLTPEEFGNRFGIGDDDLAAVQQWLAGHGFAIDETAKSRTWINFSGTVGQVEQAFHTQIHDFDVDGEAHHANTADPSIPRGLSDIVRGIVSLHDFRRQPFHSTPQKVTPDITSTTGAHFLAPADFATIYNANALYAAGVNGAGQAIAVVGRTDINLSDVRAFRSFFGLAANDPVFVHNGTAPGIVNTNEETEADLDTEWTGAVAPNATIKLVISASTQTTDGVDLSAQYIVNNNLAAIMTTSFGSCEQAMGTSENAFYNNLWSQAAAQGITSLVSSGDSGAAGCDSPSLSRARNGLAVNGLCSTPYNVCVGGTQFNDTANPGLYWSASSNPTTKQSVKGPIPEIAWNESGAVTGGSGLWATGGGVSTLYAKPSWQVAPGVPADGKRDVPDVSLTAASHDGYAVCQADVNGDCAASGFIAVGGTSASTPAFAGLMALVVQKTGFRQGNANTILYPMGNAQYGSNGTAAFRDTTSGSNKVPASPTGTIGYNTSTAYDLATGLGSVDAATLVNNWGGATSPDFGIAASPTSATAQQGATGTSTITTTVVGGFNTSVALSASGLPSGVTASFSPASIAAPGAGSSTVTFTAAAGAALGLASVTITGTAGTLTHTTTIALTVVAPPDFALSANPGSVAVVAGASNTTAITSAITGTFNASVALSASGLPSGVTVGFSPATIAAPGSGSSTMTITAASNATLGTNTITVTGTGGTKTHTASVSLTIAAANPQNPIPQAGWTLLAADSQEVRCENGAATNAFDGNPATIWVTQYCGTLAQMPHDLKIDLGATYFIGGFQYLPRQDGSPNGDINQYQFYVSSDGVTWGTPVASGALVTDPSDSTVKQVNFGVVSGRYVWLRALSEVNGNPWSVAAEINVIGALASSGPTVSALSVNPASVNGGSTSQGTVTLSAAAPGGGATVTLASKNTAAATVPATVTVPAGQTSTTFTVSTLTVTANTPVQLTASYGGAAASTTISVNSPTVAGEAISQAGWSLLGVDSQEVRCENGAAVNAFDGSSATKWVTQYCGGVAPMPHDLKIDLGATYSIAGFQYLPRQDNSVNGNIAQYQFYVSSDGVNWGTPVASGYLMTSTSDMTQKQVTFASASGRFVWLRALNEVNGNPWTVMSELNVLGTLVSSGPIVNGLAVNPTSVIGGVSSQGTVTLSAAAPSGGAVVSLASKNTAAATVPATVTVPAGLTSATFTVSTFTVTSNMSAQLTASYGGGSASTSLSVTTGGTASSAISQAGWSVLAVDSQELQCENGAATHAFDGNSTTKWVTQYCGGVAPMPHDLKIDLGATYSINGLQYLPRQDNSVNGNIAQYEFYVSADGSNWGSPVAAGYLMTSASDMTQKQVTFAAVTGRFVWLRALNEINGNPWTVASEINVLGTLVSSGPVVNALALNPASVVGGAPSQGTVTLSAVAPSGGAIVSLASNNITAATVPSTVTVPAGQTSATFTISTLTVTANTSALLTASYGGGSASNPIAVTTSGVAGAPISRAGWTLLAADSQELQCENGAATNAFDGNSSTKWVTQYCGTLQPMPHDLKIDLGATHSINGFQYLPRQDNSVNGNIAQYQFYVSSDGVTWGSPVAAGYLMTNGSDMTQKQVAFTAVSGRYVWLRAASEVNGNPWTVAAEVSVLGQ